LEVGEGADAVTYAGYEGFSRVAVAVAVVEAHSQSANAAAPLDMIAPRKARRASYAGG
jgi:hypothetical protein